jgi:hypothetical protein
MSNRVTQLGREGRRGGGLVSRSGAMALARRLSHWPARKTAKRASLF